MSGAVLSDKYRYVCFKQEMSRSNIIQYTQNDKIGYLARLGN
jgi:hypothetical protein